MDVQHPDVTRERCDKGKLIVGCMPTFSEIKIKQELIKNKKLSTSKTHFDNAGAQNV